MAPGTIRESISPNVNLNLNVRGLPQSATLAINERSARLISEGRRVYKLGLGQSPFPVPDPVVAELKQNAHQKDYLPVSGLRALRESVANFHQQKEGIEFRAEDILIGPGSKELMFLVQLVYYGDLVIPTPSWVSYAPQAQIIGRHIRWLPTNPANGLRLMPSEIERLCHSDPDRPRIIILNYPNNPTGMTYDAEELEELAAVARKYRIILISDEIYGELYHHRPHISIARYYPEGTIISSGLSKWCGAGGWRLGTFAFPHNLKWLQEAMAAVASETFTATSAPIQYAAVRAFEVGDEIEEYLHRSRRILRSLGKHCVRSLVKCGASVFEPDGAFYLFPNFSSHSEQLGRRGIRSSVEMCERLLQETGVAMLPGAVFGRPEEELSARLAYVDFDGTAALQAATATAAVDTDFLEHYCPNVVEAMDRVIGWLSNGS